MLSELEAAFVEQYLVDLNGTQAYMRVKPGCANPSARVAATRLLAKTNIKDAVVKAKEELRKNTGISAAVAIQHAWAIATADSRELMENRVGCCRYCWGKDFRYQFTAGEFERAEAELARKNEDLIKAGKPGVQEIDPRGGIGFDRRLAPNPDCPECFGEGESRPVFKDTSKLSDGAAMLFAGVEQTEKGFRIKTHSKDAALDKVFKHLGLYKERIELTGKDGGPLEIRELSDAERAVRLAALMAKAKSRMKK